MCNKLLQTYACGHSKTICTTPCTHALKTASPSIPSVTSTKGITRSSSTVSMLAPADVSSTAPSTSGLASTSRRASTSSRTSSAISSPLRGKPTATAHRTTAQVPAFRFIPPSTPSPVSPVSPVSHSPQPSHIATPPFCRPTPPDSYPAHTSPAVQESQLKFCAYYIPHHLTTSEYPCIQCYGRPEWDELRARWVESYRLGHPLDRVDGVEVLSGIRGVLEVHGGRVE